MPFVGKNNSTAKERLYGEAIINQTRREREKAQQEAEEKARRWASLQMDNADKGPMKALPSVVTVNGIEYKINFDTRREYTWSEYSKKLRKKKTAFLDKMRTAGNADEIVAATRDLSYDGYLKHERKDNYVDFMHGSILIQAGKNQYEGTTVVGVTRGGGHVLRDIVGMKPTSFKLKGEPSTAAASKHARSNMREDSPVSIIPRTNIESNTDAGAGAAEERGGNCI